MVTIDDFKNEIEKYPVNHYSWYNEDRTWFHNIEIRTCYLSRISEKDIGLAEKMSISNFRISYIGNIKYELTDESFKEFQEQLKVLYKEYCEYFRKLKEHELQLKLNRLEKDF